ncbi:lipid A 3-O-deacylase [Phycisphaerales bacterium]|nr:lipid A 3-O-deacylase [Phycisphaerales bacterium]
MAMRRTFTTFAVLAVCGAVHAGTVGLQNPGMPLDDPPAPVVDPLIPQWGREGTWWLSVGAGVSNDFADATDANFNGAATYFLTEDIEFTGELGLWAYGQPGDDAIGLNPNVIIRWHFINRQTWSLYTDVGIGLVFTTNGVPEGGNSVNFTPRAGLGATFRLSEETGVRLQVGLRWAHISNARIEGDDDNGVRDAVMGYAGLVFPF